jgi:hypothetical protein
MGDEGRGCWRTTARDGRCYRRSKVKHTSCVLVGLALSLTGGDNRPRCCNFFVLLRNRLQLPLEHVCALNFGSNCSSDPRVSHCVLTGSDAFVSSSSRGMVSSIENGGKAQHTEAQRVRGGLGLMCIASGETLGLKVRDASNTLGIHTRARSLT